MARASQTKRAAEGRHDLAAFGRRGLERRVAARQVLIFLLLLQQPRTSDDLAVILHERGVLDDGRREDPKSTINRDLRQLGEILRGLTGHEPFRRGRGKPITLTLGAGFLGRDVQTALQALACAIDETAESIPFSPAASAGLSRLMALLGVTRRNRHILGVLADLAVPSPRMRQTIDAIHRATDARQTLQFAYVSPRTGYENVIVSPYRLEIERGVAYLLARARGTEATRRFALDRIQGGVVAGGATFEDEVGRGHVHVVVAVNPYLRSVIGDRRRLDDQVWESVSDGRFLLRGTASDELAAMRLVLGWGEHAQLLEPKSLREQLRRVTAAMAGFYASPDNPSSNRR